MPAMAASRRRALDERLRPVEDRVQARRYEAPRLRVRGPEVLVMLGTAELCRHGQSHGAGRAQRDVVARDFPARVGLRLAERLAPAELERVERRLLARLAQCGRERLLVGLDETLREVPVAERTQHEVAPAVVAGPHDDDARRALARLHFAPTSRSVLVKTSCTSRTFGPLNISRGGRFECASAKSALCVQATKSAKLRHQAFTS